MIIILIFTLGGLSIPLLKSGNQLQEIKYDNGLKNNARNGLFSPLEWQCRVILLTKSVLKNEDYNKITSGLLKRLTTLYRSKTKKIKNNGVFSDGILSAPGNLWDKGVVKVGGFAIDKGGDYLATLIKENRKEIQTFLSIESSKLIKDRIQTTGDQAGQTFDQNCNPKTPQLISTVDIEKKIDHYCMLWWGLFSIIGIFLFVLWFKARRLSLILAIFWILVALVLGISLPMMEINAGITDIQFQISNYPIHFKNQSLFFQSKSIIDIVFILFISSPFVAIAIFMFSIVIPFLKLVAISVLLFRYDRFKTRQVSSWVVTFLSKWSMADVFIVAIFLANLSFQGIFKNQLTPLTEIKSPQVAINTSHSYMDIGFYFFIAYCLISIIIGFIVMQIEKGKIKLNEDKELESLHDLKKDLAKSWKKSLPYIVLAGLFLGFIALIPVVSGTFKSLGRNVSTMTQKKDIIEIPQQEKNREKELQ